MPTKKRKEMLKKAFEHAYQQIKSEQEDYICWALEDHPSAIKHIQRLMGHPPKGTHANYYSLEAWLEHNHGIKNRPQQHYRQYRLRWLKHLIETL